MKRSYIFIIVCCLCAALVFTNFNFLNESYQRSYNYNGSDYGTVSLPIDIYLSDNRDNINSFNTTVQRKFVSAENAIDTVVNMASGFIKVKDAITNVFEGNFITNPRGWQYANDYNYRSFVKSFVRVVENYYDQVDFGFIGLLNGDRACKNTVKDYFTGYFDFGHSSPALNSLSSDYYNPNYSSADLDFALTNPIWLINRLGFQYQTYLQYQDKLVYYGVPHFHIDTSFDRDMYPITIRYYSLSQDPDTLNVAVTLLLEKNTDYYLNRSTGLVVENYGG